MYTKITTNRHGTYVCKYDTPVIGEHYVKFIHKNSTIRHYAKVSVWQLAGVWQSPKRDTLEA